MAATYHHGDLRQAVLTRAVEVIEATGPDAFSLRSLAADLGVSHTAPRHHFGSREGVLTAVAVEGFWLLERQLGASRTAGGTLLDAGVTYVAFALEHRAHFLVMFTPGLTDEDDAELTSARDATFARLRGGVDTMAPGRAEPDAGVAALAAWAIVHGIATLVLNGNLERSPLRSLAADGDVLALTRRSIALLHAGTTGTGRT